jgi:hypothetical protein
MGTTERGSELISESWSERNGHAWEFNLDVTSGRIDEIPELVRLARTEVRKLAGNAAKNIKIEAEMWANEQGMRLYVAGYLSGRSSHTQKLIKTAVNSAAAKLQERYLRGHLRSGT